MGYCTFGGKPVPATTRAGCVGGGGSWTEGSSNTDDFGAPLDFNTGPQGEVYDLFGERDRIAGRMNEDAFGRAPFAGPSTQTKVVQPSLYDKTIGGFLFDAKNRARANRGETLLTQDPRANREVTSPYKDPLGGRAIASAVIPTAPPPPPPPPADSTPTVTTTPTAAPSLFDKMGTKEYWMGAEGDPANQSRVFKLGQLMEHFGTPLSRRGEHPSKTWAAQTKAGLAAQKSVSAAQRKQWEAMIPNETTLIKQFLKEKEGIVGTSAPGTPEYANAAKSTSGYI